VGVSSAIAVPQKPATKIAIEEVGGAFSLGRKKREAAHVFGSQKKNKIFNLLIRELRRTQQILFFWLFFFCCCVKT
jgi:hypothetical protein